MLRMISCISAYKKTFVFAGACFLISLLLILIARTNESFAQWYAVNLYPIFPSTIGRAFSMFKLSFSEVFLYFVVLMTGFVIIKLFWMTIFRNPLRKAYLYFHLRIALCLASSLFLIFTLTCSINYQREEVGALLNLPIEASSKEELKQLCLILIDDLSSLTFDSGAEINKTITKDENYMQKEAMNAMKQLGEKYPSLSGYYPNPKPIFFSKVLSDLGIKGIYSPFTIEANYNRESSPYLIPFTICHELAHLKGYMREEDANFIAYSACRDSSSKAFQYSGAFHALSYSLNALKLEMSREEFLEVYEQIPASIQIQFSYNREQSEGHTTRFTPIAKKVNNLYLIANAQLQGVKSYGMMVDLLIAEYADKIREDKMI